MTPPTTTAALRAEHEKLKQSKRPVPWERIGEFMDRAIAYAASLEATLAAEREAAWARNEHDRTTLAAVEAERDELASFTAEERAEVSLIDDLRTRLRAAEAALVVKTRALEEQFMGCADVPDGEPHQGEHMKYCNLCEDIAYGATCESLTPTHKADCVLAPNAGTTLAEAVTDAMAFLDLLSDGTAAGRGCAGCDHKPSDGPGDHLPNCPLMALLALPALALFRPARAAREEKMKAQRPIYGMMSNDSRWIRLRVLLDRHEYGRLLDKAYRLAESGRAAEVGSMLNAALRPDRAAREEK